MVFIVDTSVRPIKRRLRAGRQSELTTVPHALAVAELPPIHADPFDRIQVAQARLEGLTIVTRDATIPNYDVPCLHA